MLTQDRYRAILDLLDEKNSVTVSELTKLLDSSESTIRRDLSALDEMGKLTKVFGGATSLARNEGIFEDAVSNRETVMSAEKDLIAKYCAKLINDSDFVYIDAGSTTLKLVDHITNTNATYVTNGITHAKMLIHKGMRTHIVGGKIKPVTEAVVGAEAIKSINCFNFTKAFMGVNGIDLNSGFTTPDVEEGLIKEAAFGKAYMSFILADHSKFRRVYPVTFAPIDKCCIITDKLTAPDFSQATVIKEVKK